MTESSLRLFSIVDSVVDDGKAGTSVVTDSHGCGG